MLIHATCVALAPLSALFTRQPNGSTEKWVVFQAGLPLRRSPLPTPPVPTRPATRHNPFSSATTTRSVAMSGTARSVAHEWRPVRVRVRARARARVRALARAARAIQPHAGV